MNPTWTRSFAPRAAVRLAVMIAIAFAVLRCGAGGGGGAGSPGAATPAEGHAPRGATRVLDAKDLPGLALGEGHSVGAPLVIGNLAVFPVYAAAMEDIGEFTTLDAALEKGTVTVREQGPEGAGAQQAHVDGARVNTLVIENKGELPILVLAGTVVKGGKQDRQIGQDFVIGARETVPVDAFCVEHGRWNGVRDGVATHGKFKALKSLAVGDVRAAGQYERNQSEVWSKVNKVNRESKKESRSDTLTATLEDKDVAAEGDAIATRIDAFFEAAPAADHVVGLAYAIDGKVQGARWFLNHQLFSLYKGTLVTTAAVESIASRAAAKAAGQPVPPGACAPEAVAQFVSSVSQGRSEQRDTAGQNSNAYQFSDEGYAAEAVMKAPPGGKAKPKSVTKDFLKKK